MPYRSPKQRRYIYAQAAAGVPWAIKFIKDQGDTPPPISMKKTVGRAASRRRLGLKSRK